MTSALPCSRFSLEETLVPAHNTPCQCFPRTRCSRAVSSCVLGDAGRPRKTQPLGLPLQYRESSLETRQNMAKQSSLFSFFTKSPPPVSKPKPSPSPAEADLPSAVEKSNSSPKEQAKQTAQQQPTKTNGVKPKSNSKPAKAGFNKLFGDKAPAATKPR